MLISSKVSRVSKSVIKCISLRKKPEPALVLNFILPVVGWIRLHKTLKKTLTLVSPNKAQILLKSKSQLIWLR